MKTANQESSSLTVFDVYYKLCKDVTDEASGHSPLLQFFELIAALTFLKANVGTREYTQAF